jgi:hypothetical protein
MSNPPQSEPCNCGYEVEPLEHDAGCPIYFSNGRIPFYDDLITKYGPGNSAAENDAITHMLEAMRIQHNRDASPTGAVSQNTSTTTEPPAGAATQQTSTTTQQNNSDTQPTDRSESSASPNSPPEIEDLGSTYVEDHVLRSQIHDLYLSLRENSNDGASDDSEISAKVQMGWFDTIIEDLSVNCGVIMNRKDVWKALALQDAEVRSMEYGEGEEGECGSDASGWVGDLW